MLAPPLKTALLCILASAAALGLLTGCDERTGTESSPSKEAGAKTEAAKQCFFVGGGLDEKDLKLFAAVGSDDVPQVEQLIAGGANINAADALKRTPLFAAAFCGHPQTVNLLIDRGSDANARDFSGMTALHAAIVVGSIDAAKALIAKGAKLDTRDTVGRTPLHLAAATNQLALVELLLEHGANSRSRDKDGNTAGALASDNGHSKAAAIIKRSREQLKNQGQKRSQPVSIIE